MSFILEALKKSEKNRQENTTPTLDSQHDAPPSTPRKRPLWPILLLVVLLLNAGILVWLFGPWNNDQTPSLAAPSGETPVPQTTAVAPVAPASQPAIQPAIQTATPPVTPSTAPAPPRPAAVDLLVRPEAPQVSEPAAGPSPGDASVEQSNVTTQPVVATQPAKPTAAQPEVAIAPVPEPVVEAPPQPVAAPQPPARAILSVTELPGSIQQQLPRLHMSVHAFTGDQSTSLIRLNDRIMRAGSYLEDRYRLEEITSDGAIFSYQGYYFLVPRRGA